MSDSNWRQIIKNEHRWCRKCLWNEKRNWLKSKCRGKKYAAAWREKKEKMENSANSCFHILNPSDFRSFSLLLLEEYGWLNSVCVRWICCAFPQFIHLVYSRILQASKAWCGFHMCIIKIYICAAIIIIARIILWGVCLKPLHTFTSVYINFSCMKLSVFFFLLNSRHISLPGCARSYLSISLYGKRFFDTYD